MGVSLLYCAVPLVLVVLGPLFIVNCLKALRAGEGAYDRQSSGQMLVVNWLGVLVGAGLTVWAVWRIWQMISAALW
jgi:hypothetical protein